MHDAIAEETDSETLEQAADFASDAAREKVTGIVGGATPAGAAAGTAGKAAKALGQDGGGQGGTRSTSTGAPDESSSSRGRAAGAGAAASTAAPAANVLSFMALLKWLKALFFQLMAALSNLGSMIWAAVLGVVKAVAKAIATPFVAIGNMVASAVSTVTGAGTAAVVAPTVSIGVGVASVVATGGLVAGAFGAVVSSDDPDAYSGQNLSAVCTPADRARAGSNVSLIDMNASEEASAQRIFSVLSSWGMPDENIAGILGNWSSESTMDPTAVENIFDEPYAIGPRKQAAWDGGFTHIPGQQHGGIGLAQWSNGRTPMLLEYAEDRGVDWYTIETQLAFMYEGDNPGDARTFQQMVNSSLGSPSDAAYFFYDEWERPRFNAVNREQRAEAAEAWYGRIAGWEIDTEVANGVHDIMGSVVESGGATMAALRAACGGENLTSVSLQDGGLVPDDIQALMDLYASEGHDYLRSRYGAGGPAACANNGNKAMNCVSFSTYFLNRYTTFDQFPAGNGTSAYPNGNGINTARNLARMTGLPLSDTPTAYSVGSGPGSGPAGHTMVALAIEGDQVTIGEASYCNHVGNVRTFSLDWLQANGWVWVDMSGELLDSDLLGND